jgi:multidrug resistance protein, MATE family
LQEIKAHINIAWPVCLSFFMRKSTDVISVIAIGHLGSHYLSAAGIASVTANVTGNSMIWGLAGAISTICSQAAGLKDYETLSVTLQRSVMILLTCICIPVSVLWFMSAPIMQSLGQVEKLAHDASLYLQHMIPGLWALACSACIQNWLHAQAKTQAIMIITFITAVIHPFWCYLFIYHLNIGYLGAAISVSVTKCSELLMLILYIGFLSDTLKETKFNWQLNKAMHDWWSFLRLGLPNLMMMTEWWASEAIIFMAGSLAEPDYQVSAMSIYQNLISLCFMLPQGFHVSGNTRVGNALGENRPRAASLAAKVSPSLGIIISIFAAIVIGSLHRYIGQLFTDDQHVLTIVTRIIPILVFYVIADGSQTSMTGVLKGLGKQRVGGPVVLFSYYAIGLPISACCAFSWGLGLGIIGLCLGTMIGTWVHFLLFTLVIAQTNWSKEAELVQARQKFLGNEQRSIPVVVDDLDDDQIVEWWDEIDFLGSSSSSGSAEGKLAADRPRPAIQSIQDVGVVSYNFIARRFGWKEMLSEYEMVKNYTETILDDVVVI